MHDEHWREVQAEREARWHAEDEAADAALQARRDDVAMGYIYEDGTPREPVELI